MLTDARMLDLAGAAAFARGREYRDQRRIRLSERGPESLQGVAHGVEDYSLWLKRAGSAWRWSCTCPAAGGGAFCKHLVAAVLVARDGETADERGDAGGGGAIAPDSRETELPHDSRPGFSAKARASAESPGDLIAFLRAQPSERLARWLQEFADADRDVERRLRLYRAADDPATLKAAIAKALATGGFLDWRASNRYAMRLDVVVEQLRAQVARDPAAARALCEYTLGRLFRIYERSDDSSGAIGDRVRELGELHARACLAAPPGKALVKPLWTLQHADGWGFLPLASYWQALGAEGQRAYGKLVVDEFAALPATPGNGERHGAALSTLHHAEAYARCAGDFDFLMRVLRRDLSHAYDHQRVVEALREFGREREALAFAEGAVRRFPDDSRLRAALAGCLRRAGLGDEAVEQAWEAFRIDPDESSWDGLKHLAGSAWFAWRERALQHVEARQPRDASTRLRLLLHDGDAAAATALARAAPVSAHALQELAEALSDEQPETAGEFYLQLARHEAESVSHPGYPRVIAHLQRARRLAPAATAAVVAALRRDLARKPKLMALLDQAGL